MIRKQRLDDSKDSGSEELPTEEQSQAKEFLDYLQELTRRQRREEGLFTLGGASLCHLQ